MALSETQPLLNSKCSLSTQLPTLVLAHEEPLEQHQQRVPNDLLTSKGVVHPPPPPAPWDKPHRPL